MPSPHAGAPAGYALGIVRHRWNTLEQRPDLLEHGGGGFGFLSDMWWVPQLGIGVAVLTNSQDHQLQNELATSILADLLSEPGVYRDRLLALPWRAPVEDATFFEPPAGMANLVADAAMVARGDEATRWAGYSGLYRTLAWDVLDLEVRRTGSSSTPASPYFEATTGTSRPLAIASPNRARPVPRRQRRDAGPPGPGPDLAELPARSCLGWPLAMAVGDPRRGRAHRAHLDRRRAGAEPPTLPPAGPRGIREPRPPVGVGSPRLVAECDRTGHARNRDPARVAARVRRHRIPRLPRVPPAVRLALHLPLAVVVMGASTVALVAAGWVRHWWSSAVRLQYAALAVAAITLVPLLAGWHLIGWGMG